jgi:hypothetical protein
VRGKIQYLGAARGFRSRPFKTWIGFASTSDRIVLSCHSCTLEDFYYGPIEEQRRDQLSIRDWFATDDTGSAKFIHEGSLWVMGVSFATGGPRGQSEMNSTNPPGMVIC